MISLNKEASPLTALINSKNNVQIVSQWTVPQWDPKELPKTNLLHCCPLYKRELWEVSGGYSPAMVFGWEDWEFWYEDGKGERETNR